MQPVAVQQPDAEDPDSESDVSSLLFAMQDGVPRGQEEVFELSPDKGASSSKGSPEVTALTDLIKTLQLSITQLQADMNVLMEENKELKHARRNNGGDGTGDMKPLVDIDKKDVEKPHKFKGDPMQWRSWSAKFANFLGRRDERWPKLIKAIQEKSDQAMTEDLEDEIYKDMGLRKPPVGLDWNFALMINYPRNYLGKYPQKYLRLWNFKKRVCQGTSRPRESQYFPLSRLFATSAALDRHMHATTYNT